jgi:hypothetical protein
MPHDTGDATTSATEHSPEQKVNQTIPTLSDSSANCSKFPTNLIKIQKLQKITENKWKEYEKVKTEIIFEKIAEDANDNFNECEMAQRVPLESGRELHSKQLKIRTVRWYLYFMINILIYISCLSFSFWTIFILPCFQTFNDFYLPLYGSDNIFVNFYLGCC